MKRLKGFGTRRVLLFLSFFLFSLPEEKKRRLFPSSSLISQHFERVSNREVINYDIAFIRSCFLLRSIATWLLFFFVFLFPGLKIVVFLDVWILSFSLSLFLIGVWGLIYVGYGWTTPPTSGFLMEDDGGSIRSRLLGRVWIRFVDFKV